MFSPPRSPPSPSVVGLAAREDSLRSCRGGPRVDRRCDARCVNMFGVGPRGVQNGVKGRRAVVVAHMGRRKATERVPHGGAKEKRSVPSDVHRASASGAVLFSGNTQSEDKSVCGNRRCANLAQVTHCACETVDTTFGGSDREQSVMSGQILACASTEHGKKDGFKIRCWR